MSEALLHPVPRWRDVAREQFRTVGLSLRREGIGVAAALGLLTVGILAVEAHSGPAKIPFTPEAGVPATMLALLVPMAVWKGEGPARRGYLRAMPVGHAGHAIVKSLSGLVWLFAAMLGYFGWIGIMSAMTGGSPNAVEPWRWLVPFTGAAVLYLFGSALALVAAHPWRWLGGGFAAYLFVSFLASVTEMRSLVGVIDTLMYGRFGVETVVTGRALFPMADGAGLNTYAFSSWLLATWFWVAIAITVFLWAAYRQPES